jgi:hypothetical protein
MPLASLMYFCMHYCIVSYCALRHYVSSPLAVFSHVYIRCRATRILNCGVRVIRDSVTAYCITVTTFNFCFLLLAPSRCQFNLQTALIFSFTYARYMFCSITSVHILFPVADVLFTRPRRCIVTVLRCYSHDILSYFHITALAYIIFPNTFTLIIYCWFGIAAVCHCSPRRPIFSFEVFSLIRLYERCISVVVPSLLFYFCFCQIFPLNFTAATPHLKGGECYGSHFLPPHFSLSLFLTPL